MGADDRAVDHQILVVAVCSQRLKHPLPYAGMAPAAEALTHSLPFSIAFRQIAPMGTRAQNPQATIDKQPVVRAAASGIANLARQQGCNLQPLSIAQFIGLNDWVNGSYWLKTKTNNDPVKDTPFTPRLGRAAAR